MLNDLINRVYNNAINKGFYENGKGLNIGERLALIHSEVSEALEADRQNKYFPTNINIESVRKIVNNEEFNVEYKNSTKGTFEEEMADIVIRVMDMCGLKNIDLDSHVRCKIRYNSHKEKYHGKEY